MGAQQVATQAVAGTTPVPRPAIFLDRDGVINFDHGYVHRSRDFEFIPGAVDAIAKLARAGFPVVVITNQSGVGRGMFPAADVERLHDWMRHHLTQADAQLAGVYYCPHVAADRCGCRKPQAGMIFRAAADLTLDISRSWLVGDKLTDVLAARRAGISQTILVRSGKDVRTSGLAELPAGDPALPDAICDDLAASAALILAPATDPCFEPVLTHTDSI